MEIILPRSDSKSVSSDIKALEFSNNSSENSNSQRRKVSKKNGIDPKGQFNSVDISIKMKNKDVDVDASVESF